MRSFSAKCRTYTLRRVGTDDFFVEIRESPIVEETDSEGKSRRVEFVSDGIDSAEIDGRPVAFGDKNNYSYSFRRLKLYRLEFPGSLR